MNVVYLCATGSLADIKYDVRSLGEHVAQKVRERCRFLGITYMDTAINQDNTRYSTDTGGTPCSTLLHWDHVKEQKRSFSSREDHELK